jgi:hypothetical protein
MIKIDDTLLQELGLGNLSDDQKAQALDTINRVLEERVGEKLVSQLDEGQLTEFEKFIEQDDPDGAFKWVKARAPQYQQLVEEELMKLKEQIKTGGLAAISSAA